jgi:hypothetical protein
MKGTNNRVRVVFVVHTFDPSPLTHQLRQEERIRMTTTMKKKQAVQCVESIEMYIRALHRSSVVMENNVTNAIGM